MRTRRNAAIPPPWEAKSDWEAFNRVAADFSRLAEKHLGKRTDIVARVVHAPDSTEFRRGEVLVATTTDASWAPLFLAAGAIVVVGAIVVALIAWYAAIVGLLTTATRSF